MQGQSYFQLLNPLVFLLFSAGFFALRSADRSAKGAGHIALSYAFGATAFVVDFLRDAIPGAAASIVTNGLYTATGILFVSGLCQRYRVEPPARLLFIVGATNISVVAFFLFVYDDIWIRSIAINVGTGVLFSIGLFNMRGRLRTKFDKVIFAVYALMCVQLFIRPVVVFAIGDPKLSLETYTQSLFYATLHFVTGACAVMTAMALLVAYASEIISDLRTQSETDLLTGVFNRRGFETAAQRVLSRADAVGEPVGIVHADIDRFKEINDLHGHAFGDRVIARFASVCGRYAEAGHVVGRLGGEEFAILIPGAFHDMARRLAEAIQRELATTPMKSSDGEFRFTASYGVAMRKPRERLSDVLARADAATYLAKREGRNRIVSETDVSVGVLQSILKEAYQAGAVSASKPASRSSA